MAARRLLSIGLLSWALAAAAADDETMRQAHTHFKAGKAFYDLGQYEDAIRELAAGYALAPRPEFLINLGQAYRRAGEPRKAREMFQHYLEEAPAGAPQRVQVSELVTQLDTELAAQRV